MTVKLTDQDVLLIRAWHQEDTREYPVKELARIFEVDRSVITKIINRDIHTHLPASMLPQAYKIVPKMIGMVTVDDKYYREAKDGETPEFHKQGTSPMGQPANKWVPCGPGEGCYLRKVPGFPCAS
jgi:hypothetical protein